MMILERYQVSASLIKVDLCFLLQWSMIWKKYLVILRDASINGSNGPPVLDTYTLQKFLCKAIPEVRWGKGDNRVSLDPGISDPF